MSTNELYQVLMQVASTPDCQDSYNQGLYLGATMVAVAIVFYMLRRTVGGTDHEEL